MNGHQYNKDTEIKVDDLSLKSIEVYYYENNTTKTVENGYVLKEEGAIVLGIASIFTYNLQKGLDRLANASIINHSLSNFEALAKVALANNYISEQEYKKVLKFRENPDDSSWLDI